MRRPISGFCNDFQPQTLEWNVRIRGLEVQVRRDVSPLHRQHRLDEARDPGRRLQMPEIGLDRADQQRRVLGRAAAQHRAQRARLDGIAQQRARSVGLDVVDLAWLQRPALA